MCNRNLIIATICIATHATMGSRTDASDHPRLHWVKTTAVERGAEIVAFDHHASELYIIGSRGLSIFGVDIDGALTLVRSAGFSKHETWEPTSVAIDPAGRGFAVVSWIPSPSDRVPGILQVIDTSDHRVVWQMSAGYHPDCVMFSPSGDTLIIANECEPGSGQYGPDHAGGITLIDLRSIHNAAGFRGFNDSQGFGFTPDTLGDGVSLDELRISASAKATPELDIEPEYLAPTDDGVWVSLQENNALGYFDFDLSRWTRILPLGNRSIPMDACEDGRAAVVDEPGISMLDQPDTIAMFNARGSEYLLLANEGEGGDADTITLGDAIRDGRIDPEARDALRLRHAEGDAIEKLFISTIDGDTDTDGDIDIPTALGSRGISIIDTVTGQRVWDSGSQIELVTAMLWPTLYNDGDTRSDRSGPEPEGVAVGELDGRVLGFVGLERAHGVLMYDLSDPIAPVLLDAQPLGKSCNPEGLKCITIEGRSYLIVAAEGCDEVTVFEIR